MFKKVYASKFEWSGLPDGLTSLFVEDLILSSPNENFAVVVYPASDKIRPDSVGEFWGKFSKLAWDAKYGRAKRVFVTNYMGDSLETNDFVLFDNFANVYKEAPTPSITYIRAYSAIMERINKALIQHIDATKLIANVYASTPQEEKELKAAFSDYKGVIVTKSDADALFDGNKMRLVQFQIDAKFADLEELKRKMQEDCFLRLGVNTGTDKTHLTNYNIQDSEEIRDLINAYELKRREDFCKRYNAWGKGENVLSVKIHTISTENAISGSADSIAMTGGNEYVNE